MSNFKGQISKLTASLLSPIEYTLPIGNEQIAINYCNKDGKTEEKFNPNGSIKNIAGIFNKEKNVLGMMPHPERMIHTSLSGEDGSLFFNNLINNLK